MLMSVFTKRTPKYSQTAPIAAKIKLALNHLISFFGKIVFLPTSMARKIIERTQIIITTV